MKTYSSRKFAYNKETRCFTTEASILEGFTAGSFYIRSARTGKTQLFLLTEVEKADGEMIAWRGFTPGGLYNVVVFND